MIRLVRLTATTLALFAATSVAVAAQTTLLTFDGIVGHDLLHGYGDRVDGPSSGGYTYHGSGSFTPNVLLSIGGVEAGQLLQPHVWLDGYSELLKVMYLQPNGTPQHGAEMQLTLAADPGFNASLQFFDLGNFGGALTLPYIRAYNENGQLLYEDLNVVLPPYSAAARRFEFDPPPTGRAVTLRISLAGLGGQADHVGLDNVAFGQFAVPPVEIGTSYCGPAVTNTSAGPAWIRASGLTQASANELRLMVTGMPYGSAGFFMTSRTQGFVARPAGSSGNLCLGGAIGRFIAPGQVRPSGTTGVIALRVDMTRMPTPSGPVVVQAGETWRFQAWYRDSELGVATSNFSDAVAVTFD